MHCNPYLRHICLGGSFELFTKSIGSHLLLFSLVTQVRVWFWKLNHKFHMAHFEKCCSPYYVYFGHLFVSKRCLHFLFTDFTRGNSSGSLNFWPNETCPMTCKSVCPSVGTYRSCLCYLMTLGACFPFSDGNKTLGFNTSALLHWEDFLLVPGTKW